MGFQVLPGCSTTCPSVMLIYLVSTKLIVIRT
jgi:hypothetical protein